MFPRRIGASIVAFAVVQSPIGCTLVYGDPVDPARTNGASAPDGGPSADDGASGTRDGNGSDAAQNGVRAVLGVFRAGVWIVDANHDGVEDPSDPRFSFGGAGDTPVVGDWTGEGKSKIGVFKDGAWKLDANGDGVFGAGDFTYTFGGPGALPVVGRWNANARTRVGVFGAITATNGQFSLDVDGDGTFNQPSDHVFAYGLAADNPLAGSWSGSGVAGVGVVRPESSGGALSFSLDFDANGSFEPPQESAFTFGKDGDVPVVGDWNGDGRAKVGVFRDGTWRLDFDGDRRFDAPIDRELHFGRAGDVPVVFAP